MVGGGIKTEITGTNRVSIGYEMKEVGRNCRVMESEKR